VGLLLLAVGVGSALGAIPNPGDGKYYACFSKASGAMRVIDYPKVSKCPQGQKLIDWGRTGPQGPAGPGGGQGPGGPQGLGGPQGDQGIQGSPGITRINLNQVPGNPIVGIDGQTFGTATATCPAGKVVGGGFTQDDAGMVDILRSWPINPSTWQVQGFNFDLAGPTHIHTFQAYAICMTTDPGTVIATAGKGFKIAKKKAGQEGRQESRR
jgi:hypothetical protein